jgi:hypothetical protein
LRDNPDRVIDVPHAVMTHSNQDHYKGFTPMFASSQLTFGRIIHNGLVERAGDNLLGPRVSHDGKQYPTDLILDLPTLSQRLGDPGFVGAKQFPKMLRSGLATGRIANVRAVSAADAFLPGFDAGDFRIEVLRPVHNVIDGNLPSDGSATMARARTAIRWCSACAIARCVSCSAAI